MTKQEFHHNMTGAEQFRNMANMPEEGEFWYGYILGIQRLYHGVNFGTPEEHLARLNLSEDLTRQNIGVGYGKGFEGIPVALALEFCRSEYASSEPSMETMEFSITFDTVEELDDYVEFHKRESGLDFQWDRIRKEAWITASVDTVRELEEAKAG